MTALLSKVKPKKEATTDSLLQDGLVLKDRVRQLRKSLGLNQAELAKAAGVTQSAISKIELGEIHSLHGDSLMRLATALGEDPEYLRTGRRAADRPALSELETVAALYRKLSGPDRVVWLDLGQVLASKSFNSVSGSSVGSRHNAARGENAGSNQGHQDRVAQQIINQLSGILDQHGPDAFARALNSLQGAADKPDDPHPPHPPRRKTRTRT